MKITNKFVSGRKKFKFIEIYPSVGSETTQYPDVGIEVSFGDFFPHDLGEVRVRMSNEEADRLAISILTQTHSNRRYRAKVSA